MPGILIAAFVAVVYIVVIGQLGKNFQARNWPTVEGRLVDAAMEESITGDEYTTYTMYCVVINYCYQVAGHDYSGKHRAASYANSSDAEKYAAEHIPGSPVKVFYRPKCPKDSRLDVRLDVSLSIFVLLLLFVPLLVLGVFYLVDILR